MLEGFRKKARALKKQTTTLYLVYRSKDVQWYKKAFILLILLYALSPVDLIPDFIPVFGLLDDLVVVPLGIFIAIRIIPKDIWEECRARAEEGVSVEPGYKAFGFLLICLIWALVAFKTATAFTR